MSKPLLNTIDEIRAAALALRDELPGDYPDRATVEDELVRLMLERYSFSASLQLEICREHAFRTALKQCGLEHLLQ